MSRHCSEKSAVLRAGRACAKLWDKLDRPIAERAVKSNRGVAILLVMTYIIVMSATVVSSFMNSQVSFMISSNVRDDLKAYYKAKSALNLGRLMLTYQYELEEDEFFSQRIKRSKFQMYSIMDILMKPFKTGIISVDVPGANHTIASYDLQSAGVDAMRDETGDYNVKVVPEAGRLNINKFSTGANQNELYDFCMMMAGSQYNELFDLSTGDEVKMSRMELLAALIDWVDPDSEKTYISDQCTLEDSGGDEANLYNDMRKKYKVKNAKFTTLDELYEVAGFGDDLMEAFGETLTVYPVTKINVNLASAKVLYSALCNAVSDESSGSSKSGNNDNRLWACSDPMIGTQLFALSMALEGYQQFASNPMNLLYVYTVENEKSIIPGVTGNGSIVPFRNVSEFYKVVQAMIKDSTLVPKFIQYSPTAYIMYGENITTLLGTSFGLSNLTFNTTQLYKNITVESPRIFRMTAVGEYGGTQRKISVVIDFNTTGGKFLYWREY